MQFEVQAGPHNRPAGPIAIGVPDGKIKPADVVGLVDVATGKPVRAQIDTRGQLCWWNGAMKAGEKRTFKLDPKGILGDDSRVRIDESHPDEVQIWLKDRHLTTYNFAEPTPDRPRPFLYPLYGPSGLAMTRNYPMRDDVEGESHDHKHHTSCWVAWGRVNDVDHWMTGKLKTGLQVHRGFETSASGQVFGQLTAIIEWMGGTGKPRQMTEQRTYKFYRGEKDFWMFDLKVQFQLTDMDIKFGDTKEGGFCALRVASSMRTDHGGTITNAEGLKGEPKCWGQPSPWVDYVGKVKGKTVGLTIMDHPDNVRHPTRWHVRGYGLFTANPFGLSYFTRDKKNDGSMSWKKGDTVVFQYRVLLHTGETENANIVGHYANYIDSQKVAIS